MSSRPAVMSKRLTEVTLGLKIWQTTEELSRLPH